jgi:hypothetical protein
LVVNSAGHELALKVVFVFLTQAQKIDQELKRLLFGAVVEKFILADSCERFLVVSGSRC